MEGMKALGGLNRVSKGIKRTKKTTTLTTKQDKDLLPHNGKRTREIME